MRKRRAVRVAVPRTMKPMAATFEADGVEGRGRVLNVGGLGLFVGTKRPPKPGAGVRIVLEDPAGIKIEVEGTVRWNTVEVKGGTSEMQGGSPGFGMEIHRPSEDYLELYEEMLRAVGAGRRSIRRRVRPIQVRFEAPSGHGEGSLKNVSRQGLFIRTERPPVPGERVHVIFQDPAYRWIEISGTVRWNTELSDSGSKNQPGFGMLIEEPSPEYLEFYEQLVRRPGER